MAERIVSLLASGTEILYGLGLGERIVGVSHECDDPPEVAAKPRVTRTHVDDQRSSRDIDQQVRERFAANAPLYDVDIPRLVDLAPDLIITQSHCDVCAVSYHDVCGAVAGEPALTGAAIVDLNPQRLDDVFADIERIGDAAGAPESTNAYIRSLRSRVADVAQRTATLAADQRPRTICIEWIEPLMVAANWMPDLVALAGGTNGLTRAGAPSGHTAWSDVRSFDPQVIVIAPCGFRLARTLDEARLLSDLPEWSELTAVRTGRVYAVDGNAYFNRSGPRLVDSLEILAGLIHPDRFGNAAQPFSAIARRM